MGNRYPPSSCPCFVSWLPRTMIRVELQNNLAGVRLGLIRAGRHHPMKEQELSWILAGAGDAPEIGF